MIVAMTVLTSEPHPNADRLTVYVLRASLKSPPIQVTANETNTYNVGDVAAVCQVGHNCGEFEISARKIRGVLSQGMMLGFTDADPGADVEEEYKDFEY